MTTLEADAPPETEQARGAVVWVPAARPPVLTAIEAAGLTAVDEPAGATQAVISTRLARHRVGEFVALARTHDLPVVVLVHPGGEGLAVEALRLGGHVAVAEGDIDALRTAWGDDDAAGERTESLLDAYESRLGRSHAEATRHHGTMVNPVSGLPGSGALAMKFAGSAPQGAELRIMSISIARLADPVLLRFSADAQALLHRRLAIVLRTVCAPHGDLYDLGEGAFTLVAPRLGVGEAEALGMTIVDVVEAYVPDAHAPLTVAIGHAGPECSTDVVTLRELAGRAELAAGADDRSSVLGAGELVGPLATATELEVMLRLADLADTARTLPSRDDVAQIASDIAARLGFEPREQLLVRFCARIAHIGTVMAGDGGDRTEATTRLVTATAGAQVAEVLQQLGAHWDGTGTPAGLAGTDIVAAARIVAVAEALVASGSDHSSITAAAGTRFDPSVVAAATDHLPARA
jgi:hypothetical protein